VLYSFGAGILILKEESRLRVFENKIPRRILGLKVTRSGNREDFTMRKFLVCTIHICSKGDHI
jgi:hypothetical protein